MTTNKAPATPPPPANSITNAKLKGILAVWVACTVNSSILGSLAANANGERAALASTTGLLPTEVDALVNKALTQNETTNGIYSTIAKAFPGFVMPAYIGGHTCGSLDAVLAALYSK